MGTTDIDHGPYPAGDPVIGGNEIEYLMDAVRHVFPALELDAGDLQSTFAGLRAVVNTGQADPSKESREFVLWDESGMLTVTGGKLTTFRLMAHHALRTVAARLPGDPRFDSGKRVLDRLPHELMQRRELPYPLRLRLLGRYGTDASQVVESAQRDELKRINGLQAVWAELRFAAREEGVVHLEDLLLRRARLGLLLPYGGLPWIEQIRLIVQSELGWDDREWEQELNAYTRVWHASYSTMNGKGQV